MDKLTCQEKIKYAQDVDEYYSKRWDEVEKLHKQKHIIERSRVYYETAELYWKASEEELIDVYEALGNVGGKKPKYTSVDVVNINTSRMLEEHGDALEALVDFGEDDPDKIDEVFWVFYSSIERMIQSQKIKPIQRKLTDELELLYQYYLEVKQFLPNLVGEYKFQAVYVAGYCSLRGKTVLQTSIVLKMENLPALDPLYRNLAIHGLKYFTSFDRAKEYVAGKYTSELDPDSLTHIQTKFAELEMLATKLNTGN